MATDASIKIEKCLLIQIIYRLEQAVLSSGGVN